MSLENLVLRAEQIDRHGTFLFSCVDEDAEFPSPDWGVVERVRKGTQEDLEFWMRELDGMTYGGAGTTLAEAIAYGQTMIHQEEKQAA